MYAFSFSNTDQLDTALTSSGASVPPHAFLKPDWSMQSCGSEGCTILSLFCSALGSLQYLTREAWMVAAEQRLWWHSLKLSKFLTSFLSSKWRDIHQPCFSHVYVNDLFRTGCSHVLLGDKYKCRSILDIRSFRFTDPAVQDIDTIHHFVVSTGANILSIVLYSSKNLGVGKDRRV